MTAVTVPAKRGRRAKDDQTDTRQQIIDAGKEVFAARGFKSATLRAIAGDAGVDPALIIHYFGTKSGLFSACMELNLDPQDFVPAIVGDGPDGVGERLARELLRAYHDPGSRLPMDSLLRSMLVDQDVECMLRGFFQENWTPMFSKALGLEDQVERVQLAESHVLGVAISRFYLKLEPFASLSEEDLIAMMAPALQRYLDYRVTL